MNITFSKMSGNGNDFIVIDNRDGKYISLYNKNFIEKVCARGLSVGADGVIFIEKSDTVDFKWQFFNSDGSVAEMCGKVKVWHLKLLQALLKLKLWKIMK